MSPDHIAELALIEMSRLQRHAMVLTSAGYGAAELASAYRAEIARREQEIPEHELEHAA